MSRRVKFLFLVLPSKGFSWLFGKTTGFMGTRDASSLNCSKSLIQYQRESGSSIKIAFWVMNWLKKRQDQVVLKKEVLGQGEDINRVPPKLFWGLILLFSILIYDLGRCVLMNFADDLKCEICINKEEIWLSYKGSQMTLKSLVEEVGWNSIV